MGGAKAAAAGHGETQIHHPDIKGVPKAWHFFSKAIPNLNTGFQSHSPMQGTSFPELETRNRICARQRPFKLNNLAYTICYMT